MATATHSHRAQIGKRLSRQSALRPPYAALWLRNIESIIAIGLIVVMAGVTLAFGAVEPWSIAAFGLSIIALLVLWGIKGLVDRRLKIFAPLTALPLAAL